MQVLYECDMRQILPEDALRDFYHTLYTEENEQQPEADYFMEQLVFGAYQSRAEIDQLLGRYSQHWKVDRMPVVDRNILRLAAYEMIRTPTPPPVAIDQAIELARRFSGDESAKFVNGVLDALRKSEEMANKASSAAGEEV